MVAGKRLAGVTGLGDDLAAPTSYAPVNVRMIGGFDGLRASSANAGWLSPASSNAAANGCNCRQLFR